jgi:hypothetical protein
LKENTLYKRLKTRSVGLDQGLEKGGVGTIVIAAAMDRTERGKERKGREAAGSGRGGCN